MTDIPEPTLHVLSLLLGKRTAKRVYRGSLADLFLDDNVPDDVKLRLRASRELVQRWMLEEFRRQPSMCERYLTRCSSADGAWVGADGRYTNSN